MVIRRCTRLPGDGHIGESAACPRTRGHHIHHGTGKQIGSGLLDDLFTYRGGIVQNHFSLRVGDPAVKLGFNIGTHVGDGRIGAIDLEWSGPPGKTADGQGLIDIRVYHTILLKTVRKGGKSKV